MGLTNRPMGMAPQDQPTLQDPLQLPQNPQPQMRPQLLVQPNPNLNNKPVQLVQNVDNLEGEIKSVGSNELRLRSWRIISPDKSDIHQEWENENDIQPTIKPLTVVITEETK
jgi:hypothetical protein